MPMTWIFDYRRRMSTGLSTVLFCHSLVAEWFRRTQQGKTAN